MTVESDYRERFDALQQVAVRLEAEVRNYLESFSNIDRISARAKEVDRYVAKAEKLKEGKPKYQNPLTEIQDQVGVRVVVFYTEDVPIIEERILQYLRPIETKELLPESHWQFGYFGKHLVLALPKDAIPKDVDVAAIPRFFELQIKTLFQHAWSEANHDLGYKAEEELSGDHQRLLAFAAAQAWGADHTFQLLRDELAALSS